MIVVANDVKTKGVSLFDKILQKADEVYINVRGKSRFVVLDIERYKKMRENELDLAYLQTLKDLKDGHFKEMSADDHIKELLDEL